MDRFVKKITNILWVIKDKRIGVLGLAFKQNTDDVRMSPAIQLCERLVKLGAKLQVYDPQAMEKAKAILPASDSVTYTESMDDVPEGCDAIVIATEWPKFTSVDLVKARQSMRTPIIFDGRNLLDRTTVESHGFLYHGVGR
jgi:UDPglucose 6-dehydrogenase